MALPENIDSTYADATGKPSVKIHQQHHDEIHEKVNRIPATGTIANQDYVDNAASGNHDHDADYSDISHTHTGFSATGHTHEAGAHTHTGYSATGHDHDADYSDVAHTHNDYSATGHAHTESDISDLAHYTTSNANTDIDARVDKTFVDALNVDAGTLDGVDSTGFATAAHTHTGYSATGHDHDADYSMTTHTHTEFGVVDHNDQSGTTYQLVLTDAGAVVRCTNASAVTVTVPTNATEAFAIGTVINIYSAGAGGVTVSPAGGVTIRNNGTALSQYDEVSLRKDNTDEWVRTG